MFRREKTVPKISFASSLTLKRPDVRFVPLLVRSVEVEVPTPFCVVVVVVVVDCGLLDGSHCL